MKLLGAIIIVAMMSLTAQANTTESVFGNKSLLAKQLQTQMIDLITEKCPQDITPYGLTEIETLSTSDDQGVESEIQYETNFSSRYYFDGMHPSTQQIKVLSSKRVTHVGKTVFTIHKLMTDAGCEF